MDCLILDYQTYFPKALPFLLLQKLGKTVGNALDESIYFLAGTSYLHNRTYFPSLVQWMDLVLYLPRQLTRRVMQHTNPSGLGYFERLLARNNLSPAPSFQSTHNKCPA